LWLRPIAMIHAVLTVGSDDVRDDMQAGWCACMPSAGQHYVHEPTTLLLQGCSNIFPIPRSRFFRNQKSVDIPDVRSRKR
jgi:hypothetical protein